MCGRSWLFGCIRCLSQHRLMMRSANIIGLVTLSVPSDGFRVQDMNFTSSHIFSQHDRIVATSWTLLKLLCRASASHCAAGLCGRSEDEADANLEKVHCWQTSQLFPPSVPQGNDIVLCDGPCDRAYHEQCLQPPLDASTLPEDQPWLCPACTAKVQFCWSAFPQSFDPQTSCATAALRLPRSIHGLKGCFAAYRHSAMPLCFRIGIFPPGDFWQARCIAQ